MTDIDEMLNLAKKYIKNSYSPYSKYPVAAVVKTKKGRFYSGVNIENASYGLTICAERVAIFKAVSEGDTEIEKVLVYAPSKNFPYPCGACRQVIAEFNLDAEIIVVNGKDEKLSYNLKELLPMAFTTENLTTNSKYDHQD